jgi:hypothetical protein
VYFHPPSSSPLPFPLISIYIHVLSWSPPSIMSENIWYLAFWAWFILFSICTTNDIVSFFCAWCHIIYI